MWWGGYPSSLGSGRASHQRPFRGSTWRLDRSMLTCAFTPHDSIIYVVPPKVNGALSILARQTADGSEGVRITYDGGLHVVSESKNPLGQAASALHTDGGVPLPPGTAGKWTLRVFIDKSIVEAHLNARRSITSRFYPQDLAVGTGAFGLKLHNAAPNATMLVDSVEVWGMRGIY